MNSRRHFGCVARRDGPASYGRSALVWMSLLLGTGSALAAPAAPASLANPVGSAGSVRPALSTLPTLPPSSASSGSSVSSTPQTLRDPTEIPAAAQAPTEASSTSEDDRPHAPRHIVIVDHRAYLIEGGRRLGVGDTFGRDRIERIDADAVWLRDATGLRRVPLYAGVTKRAVPEAASSAAASASQAARIDRSRTSPQRPPTKDVP